MSFSGYNQCICKKGHYYISLPEEANELCPCGAPPKWVNPVSTTNGKEVNAIKYSALKRKLLVEDDVETIGGMRVAVLRPPSVLEHEVLLGGKTQMMRSKYKFYMSMLPKFLLRIWAVWGVPLFMAFVWFTAPVVMPLFGIGNDYMPFTIFIFLITLVLALACLGILLAIASSIWVFISRRWHETMVDSNNRSGGE